MILSTLSNVNKQRTEKKRVPHTFLCACAEINNTVSEECGSTNSRSILARKQASTPKHHPPHSKNRKHFSPTTHMQRRRELEYATIIYPSSSHPLETNLELSS
jgi:hypothetical protein